jgi:uncharacterized protein
MSQSEPGYQPNATSRPGAAQVTVDEGLRAYLLGVYNYMASGVLLSGVVAYVIYGLSVTDNPLAAAQANGAAIAISNGLYLTSFGFALFRTPLMLVIALAPLAVVFLVSWRIEKLSPEGAQLAFWLFAGLMGASLSTILLRYATASIVQAFFITAASFAALSLYGYTTRRDLSGWGAFLIMGVFGLIIASLINLFLRSSGLQFAVSVIAVLIFAGLTAYDTQRIKDLYYQVAGDVAARKKAAIMGALSLYLDFINIFISLLYLFSDRR